MDKAYLELLENLKSQEPKFIDEDGLEILVKEIPDCDSEGIMDPRVNRVMEEQKEMAMEFAKPDIGLEELRAMMGWPNEDVTSIPISTEELRVKGYAGDIRTLVYSPTEKKVGRPCIIYFHGGGFIGGSLKTVENPCKVMVEEADAVVISVDYKLAPEHKYPLGMADCFDVVTYVYNNAEEIGVDSGSIGVAGDSAGGNLATVCALKDKELGTNMIKFQGLIYPSVNIGGAETSLYTFDPAKYKIAEGNENAKAAVMALADASMDIIGMYLNDKDDMKNPYVAPIFAKDLKGMPPVLIINAEYDYLRLEGEAYGRKLKESQVPVTMIRYNGMDHGFIDKVGLYPQAEDCMREIAKGLLKALGK